MVCHSVFLPLPAIKSVWAPQDLYDSGKGRRTGIDLLTKTDICDRNFRPGAIRAGLGA